MPRLLSHATADFPQIAEAEFRYARAAYTGRDDAPAEGELDQFLAASAFGEVLQALSGQKISVLPRASGRRLMLSTPPPRALAYRVAV